MKPKNIALEPTIVASIDGKLPVCCIGSVELCECVVYLQNQAGTGLGELAGAARRAGSHGSSSWGSTHGLEAEQRQWSDTETLQHSTGEMVTW